MRPQRGIAMHSSRSACRQSGVTLIELLASVVILGLLVAGLSAVSQVTLESRRYAAERHALLRDANFAMQRMVFVVSRTRRVLVPQVDHPATPWAENIREQTVPASPPTGDSGPDTAVLAVTLPLAFDLDYDGVPDADNDRDGRIDEDLPKDATNDDDAGIHLVDDNGDGAVDEFSDDNDDEDRLPGHNDRKGEDPINAFDDDGDGSVDEDADADMNGDDCPGKCGVDDDGDSLVDEGDEDDDDEDGSKDEDWYDVVVFRLVGTDLTERLPVPWDENGGSGVTGRDFVVSTIAENVTRVRFERPDRGTARAQLIDITLELTGAAGQVVTLNRRVRAGVAP